MSLSMRYSLAASRSLRSRPSLVKSASGRPRNANRVVHFQDSMRASLKTSLRSVREDEALGVSPLQAPANGQLSGSGVASSWPRPQGGRQGAAAAAAAAPGCDAGLEAQLPPPARAFSRRCSRRMSRSLNRSGGAAVAFELPPLPSASASLLSVGGSSAAGDDARSEVASRISCRRGGTFTKSVMLDEQQVGELLASRSYLEASLPRSHCRAERKEQASGAGRPERARQGGVTPTSLGLLARDASQTGPSPASAPGGRRRSRQLAHSGSRGQSRLGAAAAADVLAGREDSCAVLTLPPIPVPSRSGTGGGDSTQPAISAASSSAATGVQAGLPAAALPTLAAPRGGLRQASRGRQTAVDIVAEAPHQQQQQQQQHQQQQRGAAGVQQEGPSSQSPSPVRVRRARSRGRSPATRSLSRSRPSLGSSRASSRALSRGPSRASSRGSSTGRSCMSRCSSRSSVHRRSLSRDPSQRSLRVPPLRLPSVPSPRVARPAAAPCSHPGTTARPDALPPLAAPGRSLPGILDGSSARLLREDASLQQQPPKLLNRLGSISSQTSRNHGRSSSSHAVPTPRCLTSESMGGPSSAMLASLLSEFGS